MGSKDDLQTALRSLRNVRRMARRLQRVPVDCLRVNDSDIADLVLSPAYVLGSTFRIYASALPMAAVFWMLSVLIPSPIFSVGIGLASIVPSVLVINTEFWYAYPVSYPFYFLMVEYGRAAEGVYETEIDWIPLIPAALLITAAALLIACIRFQRSQKV